MSDVNKLDNKQCSFDPEQYKVKVDDTVAPVGSFPWAMIQVYLGNLVYRSEWDVPHQYLKFIPKSTGGDGENIPPQIWMINKGEEQPWSPSQDDLTSCDWSLLELSVFDITSAYSNKTVFSNAEIWGYIVRSTSPLGSLTNIVRNKDIAEIEAFCWERYQKSDDSYDFNFMLFFMANKDKESAQRLDNLIANKTLYVMVDGVAYNLGTNLINNSDDYEYEIYIKGSEAQKLGTILMQMAETKSKKRFYCYWH
ncbi:Thoeris anti-defense Tad2 family protein [Xenorhabdus innexi]|uniref:Uncharacterized protein n=1 Tax=Xenorhabdus innexi TaxID=290109 RepID=A0A1N6MZA9_9GAMM|nr:MW1434 family type I TA system toxin [Xenorhabdus innexi]PHM23431.1 hypothetical protein Xinn_04116 [Xenorhabdus innexi]SIP74213.1 conserved hypothetical protein [Xenorhabdus innexi]